MLYFIAIVAPDEINKKVMVWKKYMEQKYRCKVALKSPAHITLVPPFSMAADRENELAKNLEEFAHSAKSFSIRLKDFDSFKPRVIFLHVEPGPTLLILKDQLDQYLLALNTFSFKKEDRPFHPHITIANRDLNKKDFGSAWAYFQHLSYEAQFVADGISLLRHNNKEWEIANTFEFI